MRACVLRVEPLGISERMERTLRRARGAVKNGGNFALTARGDGDNVPPSFGPVPKASSKIALETCNGVASQLARRFSAGTRQGSKQRSVRTTLKQSPAKI